MAVDRLVAADELTAAELLSLRLIVARSYMTQNALPVAARTRLLELGLIQRSMGGLMPTPSGRICARVLQ